MQRWSRSATPATPPTSSGPTSTTLPSSASSRNMARIESQVEGFRGDLVGQGGGRGEGARTAAHLGVAENDLAPALRDPSFRHQIVVDDGREEAQLDVDREQLTRGVVTRSYRRHDDGVDHRGDHPAVHDPGGLTELGPVPESHPGVALPQLVDLDAQELRA